MWDTGVPRRRHHYDQINLNLVMTSVSRGDKVGESGKRSKACHNEARVGMTSDCKGTLRGATAP